MNGSVALSGYAPGKAVMSGAEIKVVNIAQDIATQLEHSNDSDHVPGSRSDVQTRSAMQQEAVQAAVTALRAHQLEEEPGIPRGEARGKIILPCGTGKTRIALRIVEELTFADELSVVLCPSIALVAQTRREFLNHTVTGFRAMAVCSDQGVADNDEKVANTDDTTVDRGMATTDTIKGCPVTTDTEEIAEWVRDRRGAGKPSIIFGTYQSARRVSDGILQAEAGDAFKVLVCDEAHRTAGIRRRKRGADQEQRLREFTLCHDPEAFPAAYRVYQTATPRIYGEGTVRTTSRSNGAEYVVRDMDDQTIFGCELYRRSYAEAVQNDWLSDYRIIAMAVGGQEAIDLANELVREADEKAELEAEQAARLPSVKGSRKPRSKRSRLPTTGDYLKGMAFALAMGGAAVKPTGGRVPLKSCIGFLNTIDRSKAMTTVLQSDAVKEWVSKQTVAPAPDYVLEHLDASSAVARRDHAKQRLAQGSTTSPHGIMNVGIFGEGTDSPSLSSVAFLEPRRSPIDVVQAVGRVMRKSAGKELGYIIVPVVIPAGVNAEEHLAISDKHEGWRELGEILQALRAHDSRIEDALPDMLTVQTSAVKQQEMPLKTAVAVGKPDKTRLEYAIVTGSRETAEDIARASVKEDKPLLDYEHTEPFSEDLWQTSADEPTSVIVHAQRPDQSTVTKIDTVVRHKPKPNEQKGKVNERQTKRLAAQIASGKREAKDVPSPAERALLRKQREEQLQHDFEQHIQGTLMDLSGQLGGNITMNLLEKSGLTANRVQRDLNLLADAVNEAARYLKDETGLAAELDAHFGIDRMAPAKAGKPRADGSTIAALLWMNAAMLHQRVEAGRWLARTGIKPLSEIKASSKTETEFRDSWQAITRQDFLPVIEPAIDVLQAAESTDRLAGLRRALRHIATEAERIAETYADMGVDHAGALFNKVMGDQASDGAFFTRPVAADIAARLALDALDPDNSLDWSDPNVWRDHKTVDLACGSGTLLAAVLAEMKRRARLHGATPQQLAELQKVAVEDVLKGFDVNPVSLQLAATQLMAGNRDVKYRRMGLHRMPYGEQKDGTVAAGSVELLGSEKVIAGRLFYDQDQSMRLATGAEVLDGPEMEDAADDATDARIVIMNPPFTNRIKMGEKFDERTRQRLRRRMDTLEGLLETADRSLSEFLDKNSLRPRFAALADLCLDRTHGVFATVIPTTALTNTSGLAERKELAKRFHVHTILTCHQAVDVGLSQNSGISESIVVLKRENAALSPTRIISLSKIPNDHTTTLELLNAISNQENGNLANGWGEISSWPRQRIADGDWTISIWHQPSVADAASGVAEDKRLRTIASVGLSSHSTGQQLSNGYRRSTVGEPGSFPILDSKGITAQQTIEAQPDEYWKWEGSGAAPILAKAGYLLVTSGHKTSASRLTAVASQHTYVGRGWRPITGATPEQAQALSVFINSTLGRLSLMRMGGRLLIFPNYNVTATDHIPVPDIQDKDCIKVLRDCWLNTRQEIVPLTRTGYTDVRQEWDRAVCEALDWDIAHVSRLGELLAQEPRVRGQAHGEWKP